MFGFFFKLFLLFAANGLALWAIDSYILIESFNIAGGMHAYLYVGTLIGLMNLVLKPILYLVTLPFRLLMMGGSSVVFNSLFIFFSQKILLHFPETQTLLEVDGVLSYLFLGLLLAFANAIFHAFGIE